MTFWSSKTWLRLGAALPLVFLGLGAGCGDDSADDAAHDGAHDADGAVDPAHAAHDEMPVGPDSGATCPDDAGTLTYEDFGKPFVEKYCVRCHSSELTGAARNGATPDHDYDTLEGILVVANHVDQLAAAGPDSTNTVMPPNGDKPTLEERKMLGEWLACELQ